MPIDSPLSNSLNDWLEYIDSINSKSISLGLDRVKKVKEICNLNPDFPVIIVAGTNGKGSSCKFLESILYYAGFKVGCYTSPHLFNFNERISINKDAIINFDAPPNSVLEYAKKISANVSIIDTNYKINCKHKTFDYIGEEESIVDLPYPKIHGLHQLRNITGVLRCIELLRVNLEIKKEAIIDGLLGVNLRGRAEIISQNPFIVVDVAHNPEAALSLYNVISKSRNKGKLRAVFSILKDKSIKDVIKLFVDIVDEWHISKINSARAMPTIEIINAIKSYRSDALIYSSDNLHGAYMNACEKTSLNDNIVVFGSFYTVSECLIK